VNKVAAENRPASKGRAVASACSTVTLVAASRPASARASRSSISTAVSAVVGPYTGTITESVS